MSRRGREDLCVSFPHMGSYSIPMCTLGGMLDCEVMVPPKMTKRTLELGARYSPEFVCIPFKYNLGNFIEALDAGANLLIQAGGGCPRAHLRALRDSGRMEPSSGPLDPDAPFAQDVPRRQGPESARRPG